MRSGFHANVFTARSQSSRPGQAGERDMTVLNNSIQFILHPVVIVTAQCTVAGVIVTAQYTLAGVTTVERTRTFHMEGLEDRCLPESNDIQLISSQCAFDCGFCIMPIVWVRPVLNYEKHNR